MTNRKQHWENVYRNKSPVEVSWYQESPALSLRLIKAAATKLSDPLIDVGGGASLLVDELCAAGYSDISVLDVSAASLEIAKKRLAGKACDVQWLEQDITAFNPPKTYALWHDRAVFHFLTDPDDRKKYVSILKKALKPGGQAVIMAFAIDGPQKCSGLDVVRYDSHKLIEALGPGFGLAETGDETHLTPTGNRQKFAYFRLIYTPKTPGYANSKKSSH